MHTPHWAICPAWAGTQDHAAQTLCMNLDKLGFVFCRRWCFMACYTNTSLPYRLIGHENWAIGHSCDLVAWGCVYKDVSAAWKGATSSSWPLSVPPHPAMCCTGQSHQCRLIFSGRLNWNLNATCLCLQWSTSVIITLFTLIFSTFLFVQKMSVWSLAGDFHLYQCLHFHIWSTILLRQLRW